MIQTNFNAFSLADSQRLRWSSLSLKGKRRLGLWAFSALWILVATSVLQGAIQNQAPVGIIFGILWIAAILVNSAILDYLLHHFSQDEAVDLNRED